MENVSEAMAQAQLELLYKIGVLVDDRIGRSRVASRAVADGRKVDDENDPHAFLNRLPPATTHSIDRRSSGLNSMADLEEIRQNCVLKTNYGDRETSAGKNKSGCSRSLEKWQPSVRSGPSEELHGNPATCTSTHIRAYTRACKISCQEERTTACTQRRREAKLYWFREWRKSLDVRRCGQAARARGTRRIQRSIFQRWWAYTCLCRRDDDRSDYLLREKTIRSVRKWRKWTFRNARLSYLLSSQGNRVTLANRARMTFKWKRWVAFVTVMRTRRQRKNGVEIMHRRLVLRSTWCSLCVYLSQMRCRRRRLGIVLGGLRRYRTMSQSNTTIATTYYNNRMAFKMSKLFRVWRQFTLGHQHELRRIWMIQATVSRGRYFGIWATTLYYARRIEHIRARCIRQQKIKHFQSWHLTACAIMRSRHSTFWQSKSICVCFFQVWRRWTLDSARHRQVTFYICNRKVTRAFRWLRSWTLSERKTRIQGDILASNHRRRVLNLFWHGGWMVYLRRQQMERRRTQQMDTRVKLRIFSSWMTVWKKKQYQRNLEVTAEDKACKSLMRQTWGYMSLHVENRRKHKREMCAADSFYHQHLLKLGVENLIGMVDRACQSRSLSHFVRSHRRKHLKRTAFDAWNGYARTKCLQSEKVRKFHQTLTYTGSNWNPKRKWWNMWLIVLQERKMSGIAQQHYRILSERATFSSWKFHTLQMKRLRKYLCRGDLVRKNMTFASWRSRARHQQRKMNHINLAKSAFVNKLQLKTIGRWYRYVCVYAKRIKSCILLLESLQAKKLTRNCIGRWHARCIRNAAHQQVQIKWTRVLLTKSINRWHRQAIQSTHRQHQINAFSQRYGIHPVSSPLRGMWDRWKAWTTRNRSTREKHTRYWQQICRHCLNALQTYCVARISIRSWHNLSVASAAINGDLGKRRRLFRLKLQRIFMLHRLIRWHTMIMQQQCDRDRMICARAQVLRSIEKHVASNTAAHQFNSQIWLRRWRRALDLPSTTAYRYYKRNRFRQILQLWWNHTVHCKQERVLREARRVMDQLSHYQSALVPRGNGAHRVKRGLVEHVPVSKDDRGKLHGAKGKYVMAVGMPPRRMADPSERKRYASMSRRQPNLQEIINVNKNKIGLNELSHAYNCSPTGKNMPHSSRHSHSGYIKPSNLVSPTFGSTMHCLGQYELPRFDANRDNRRTTDSHLQQIEPWAAISTEGTQEIDFQSDSVTRNWLEKPEDDLSMNRDKFIDEVRRPPYEMSRSIVSGLLGREKNHDNSHYASPRPMHSLKPPAEQPSCSSTANASSDGRRIGASPGLIPPADVESIVPIVGEPPLFRGDESLLGPIHVPRKPNETRRNQFEKSQRPVLFEQDNCPREDVENLAEILELPSHTPNMFGTKPLQQHAAYHAVNTTCVLNEILKYYASDDKDAPMPHNSIRRFRTTQCYRMLRDLEIFHNGFFVTSMERTIMAVSTTLQHGERDFLREVLLSAIRCHPDFQLHMRRTQNGDAFEWLAHVHMQNNTRLAKQDNIPKRKSSRIVSHDTPYWIRSKMPLELNIGIQKLIKCFKKYRTLLEKCFQWNPDDPTIRSDALTLPKSLMDKNGFVMMMKHAGVFPHLFDRRELADAVERSGGYHFHSRTQLKQGTISLNFPQFVEALVRCSSRLQWGKLRLDIIPDPSNQSTAEIVIVVKFLMLLFTMEGHGSILKERNEDLKVVLGFLQHQHSCEKKEKMARFQELLRAAPPTQGDKPSDLEISKRSYTCPGMISNPTDPSIYLDGRRSGTPAEPMREPARNHPRSEHDFSRKSSTTPHSGISNQCDQRIHDDVETDPRELSPALLEESSDHSIVENYGDGLQKASRIESRPEIVTPLASSYSSNLPGDIRYDGSSEIHTDLESLSRLRPHPSATRLDECSESGLPIPVKSDDFIDDILSSIGDVELLLQHSEVRNSTRTAEASFRADDNSQGEIDVNSFRASHPQQTNSTARGNFSASNPVGIDTCEAEEHIDDLLVHVQDPFLNNLTQVDRFTETQDLAEHSLVCDNPTTPTPFIAEESSISLDSLVSLFGTGTTFQNFE